MDLHQTLFHLIERHRLNPEQTRTLQQLAGIGCAPPNLPAILKRGIAILAAALFGLGVIMWVAANWASLGRIARFGALEALVAVMCVGAALRGQARAPLALAGMLGIGALWAYFGQTYQTGADPWQLFALWALLGLPLALATRSDLLWAPWALVVATAMSLWIHARVGYRWDMHEEFLRFYYLVFVVVLALCALLSPLCARFTGAGIWSFRFTLMQCVMVILIAALPALFTFGTASVYGFGLVVMAAMALLSARRSQFDIFGLSAAALGLNVLLIFGLGKVLLENSSGDKLGSWLFISVVAGGMMAATVVGIMGLQRKENAHAAAAAKTGGGAA